MHDRATWKTAAPLWKAGLAGTVELDRPAILRFDSDDFMQRLQGELEKSQRDIGALLLRAETWRNPLAGPTPAGTPELPRLYQPIHGRFYLVSGGLVCERYGLPDKVIHPTCDESVFAVLRRLEPTGKAPVEVGKPATYAEFGWVPAGESGTWKHVGHGLAVGEDRLAMFPMTYADGHPRRILAGMVPVAAREKYESALPEIPVPIVPGRDPASVLSLPGRSRLEVVVVGFEGFRALAAADEDTWEHPESLDRLRESLFFAMVDLATFLAEELADVWNTKVPAPTGLAQVFAKPAFGRTWLQVLREAYANRGLVLADLPRPPTPLTNASVESMVRAVEALGVPEPDPNKGQPTVLDQLFLDVSAALDAVVVPTPGPTPPDEKAEEDAPSPSRTPGAVYVVRLVYERPRCPEPQRVTLSKPTRTFRLAHFHDPDAPFRDNRIVLPIDTSLEGLRKFPRAVRMDVSAQLRKQMERIQAIKLKDLDEGNIPEEGPVDLGMICSLSIPIITICALILMMLIISLLNIVFFWVPLFKICKPKVG